MQPLLVHYCQACTYNTTVAFTVSVFSENCSCAHCGAISEGVNVRGKHQEQEAAAAAAANMQQEELSRLFSANLTLGQSQQPEQQHACTPQTPVQAPQHTPATSPIVYSSTHYNHSHHVGRGPAFPPSPPTKTHISASDLATILLGNSIDPSLLFPSQIDLFQNADDDQRLRLLELWRISPPQDNTSRQLYDWPPTSLAQEEVMAKLRYERSAQASDIIDHEHTLSESMVMNMSPRSESPAVRETRDMLTSSEAAEPYIVSGYDMLAKREYEASTHTALAESLKYNRATDPVYNSAGGWGKNVGSIVDMENQYGAFASRREYADEEMVM